MDKQIREEPFTHSGEGANPAKATQLDGGLVDDKGVPIGNTGAVGDVGQLGQGTWSGSAPGDTGYQGDYSGKEGSFTEPINTDRGG